MHFDYERLSDFFVCHRTKRERERRFKRCAQTVQCTLQLNICQFFLNVNPCIFYGSISLNFPCSTERNERGEREGSEGGCADSTVHPLVIYICLYIYIYIYITLYFCSRLQQKCFLLHRTKRKPMHFEWERLSDFFCAGLNETREIEKARERKSERERERQRERASEGVCADSTAHPNYVYLKTTNATKGQ